MSKPEGCPDNDWNDPALQKMVMGVLLVLLIGVLVIIVGVGMKA